MALPNLSLLTQPDLSKIINACVQSNGRTYTLSNLDGNPHDGPSGTIISTIPVSKE